MRSGTLKNQGAPIDIIVPTDGVGYDLEGTAVVKGTKNQAAAERLADYAVSAPAMALYGKYYAVLALPGVTSEVKGYPADFEARMINADVTKIAADRDRILKEWGSRFDAKSAPR